MGYPASASREVTPNRKSLIASRSFGRAIESRHELEESVRVLRVARGGEDAAAATSPRPTLVVFVETNTFKPAEPQICGAAWLPAAGGHMPTTGKLIRAAMAVLAVLWRPGFKYKKAGVMLLDLVPAAAVGGGLFDPPDDDRSHARMQALDAS